MKLGGQALGTFEMLDRTARKLATQSRDLVESVNHDRVTRAPEPYGDKTHTTEVEEEPQDVKPMDLCKNNSSDRSWLVKRLLAHLVHMDGTIEFHVEWDGT